MMFYASIPSVNGTTPKTLIISANSHFDAKAYAERMLGTQGLLVQLTGEDAVPDVALQWIGTDAGDQPRRRLQIRYRKPSGWTDWEDLRT